MRKLFFLILSFTALYFANSIARCQTDCVSFNSKEAMERSLLLKKQALESIPFSQIMNNPLPAEEKPCTASLYACVLENNNYWFKFYCDIIAEAKGYASHSASIRLKLLEDEKLQFNDHIALALEYARFNKLEMMDKLFVKSIKQMNQCPLVREFIWSPDNFYLINSMKEFYPQDSKVHNAATEQNIKRFSKLAYWTTTLYPNFIGKSILASSATELLLRNAQYYDAKQFKDFSLNQSLGFGFYGVDLFELSSVYKKEIWILKILIFILPVFILCTLIKLKSVLYYHKYVERAFLACSLLILAILLLIIDSERNYVIINFVNKAPVDFKSGLIKSPATSQTIDYLYSTTRSPYAKFLRAFYFHNNADPLQAIDIYESILTYPHIKSALKTKVLNNMGAIYYLSKDNQQARSYFARALEITKNFAPSSYNLYLVTGDKDLLKSALDKEKSKINYLQTYEPQYPFFVLLDYKELSKLFCLDKSYFNLIRGIFSLKNAAGVELYLKLELLTFFLIMLAIRLFLKKADDNSEDSSKKKSKRWYQHVINLFLPGDYFIQSGRFILGIVFMFGFFISLALFINLYTGENELLSGFSIVQDWVNMLKADDFNSAALLNPILYSVCLYFIFLIFFPNILISLLGIDLEKK